MERLQRVVEARSALDLVPLLDLIVEEELELERLCGEVYEREKILFHRLAHGDPHAKMLYETDKFPIRCYYAVSHAYAYLSRLFWALSTIHSMMKYPLLYVRTVGREPEEIKSDAERARRMAHELAGKLLDRLLKLKPATRRYIADKIKSTPSAYEYFKSLYGDEILDILGKSRVEVKLVLKVEDVIPLVRKYGREWRKALRRQLLNIH